MRGFLFAAETYVSFGWRVLPIHTAYAAGCSCRAREACRSAGKHPRTEHGVHDATRAAPRILEWATSFADANIAIATGRASDLLVLDIDPRNGGRATLASLEQEFGCLPPTTETITGGGGSHFFFRAPPIAAIRGSLGSGIDVKFEGGYVVVPPSDHASGAEYAWASGRDPGQQSAAVLPKAWLEKLTPAGRPATSPGVAQQRPRRGRDSERELRARRYARSLPPAISGQCGHRTAFRAALMIAVGFDIDEQTAFNVLLAEWNPRCVPPWSERELRRKVHEAGHSARFVRGFLLSEGRPR
jgi:hypothetical protein